MCFGVRDAIALEHADAGPLTILGDLLHNPTVLSTLEAKGIAVADDVAHVKTQTLMVTAHGTSERTLARTRALGLTVVEATCPLVHVAHVRFIDTVCRPTKERQSAAIENSSSCRRPAPVRAHKEIQEPKQKSWNPT